MSKENAASVAIVEDKPDIRDYLCELINEHPRFTCRHKYHNGEEAIDFLPKTGARIAVVDIGLPGRVNGIECVRAVKPKMPDTLFMMYTVFEDADKIFESLKAGASGYLLKDASDSKILSSLEDLLEGGAPMSSSIAKKVIEFFQKKIPISKATEVLSGREHEILQLLSKGRTYSEIANVLGIKEGTVKVHIHNIYTKLHVTNSREAIEKAFGNGD
ncbi:MAG: response regulator transcription factor [Saprospiraceae bacterium]|nr:response regulator transcription factor [Saprospiraceae bacterium]